VNALTARVSKDDAERKTRAISRRMSLPGLTRQSIILQKMMDARINRAFTPVFDGLCPGMTIPR